MKKILAGFAALAIAATVYGVGSKQIPAANHYVDDVNGRVGLGLTDPDTQLHIESSSGGDYPQAFVDGNGYRLQILRSGNSGGYQIQAQSDTDIGTANASGRKLTLQPGGGNVGIGTGTAIPAFNLDILGTSGDTTLRIENSAAASQAILRLTNQDLTWEVKNKNGGNFVIRDVSGGTDRMTIVESTGELHAATFGGNVSAFSASNGSYPPNSLVKYATNNGGAIDVCFDDGNDGQLLIVRADGSQTITMNASQGNCQTDSAIPSGSQRMYVFMLGNWRAVK